MAYALSRRYILLSTLDARFLGFEHIKELYKDDSDFNNVYNACETSGFGKFYRLDGYLFKESRLYVKNNAVNDGFRNRFTIVKDGKTITIVPLSSKQVYDDQMKLKREFQDGKSENSREDNGERRPSDSAKPKSLIKPVESGGKTRGVKKVRLCDDNSVEKLKKQPNFYAKEAQIISVFSLTSR